MTPTLPTFDPLLWEALPDLNLNIAQTAELCGISVRQLGYWTRQGYVTAQGKGTRRTYGLESVRRLLAIRKAMNSGLSLRQALRSVADLSTSSAPPITSPPITSPPITSPPITSPPITSPPITSPPITSPPAAKDCAFSLSPSDTASLSEGLHAFFLANGRTRDHAGGLAIKLGRLKEDVQAAAEALCATGILVSMPCAGMTVYRQAGEKYLG